MVRSRALLVFFATCLVTFSMIACSNEAGTPAPPPDTRAADEATIRANDADFVKAAQAKDLDKAVSHYMDDAVIFAPGAPAVAGKANIRKFFQPIINGRGPAMQFSLSDVKVDVARSGDLAMDSGLVESTGKDAKGKPTSQKSMYVLVWKKQPDGSWKIAADTSANEK